VVSPFLESVYLPSVSSTNPAFLSSRRPLLTRNNGCPVLPATSSGVNAPPLSDFSVAIPLEVGLPSGDTQGILSALGQFLGADVPVFAVVAFFESFLCLLNGGRWWDNNWVAWFPVGGGSYFVLVCCLQGVYQP
jgi:hypothetical protein